jgi:hypothetical protein
MGFSSFFWKICMFFGLCSWRRPALFFSLAKAAGFLEALLAALDDEAVVGPFVPMAFRVLAPVKAQGLISGNALEMAIFQWEHQ